MLFLSIINHIKFKRFCYFLSTTRNRINIIWSKHLICAIYMNQIRKVGMSEGRIFVFVSLQNWWAFFVYKKKMTAKSLFLEKNLDSQKETKFLFHQFKTVFFITFFSYFSVVFRAALMTLVFFHKSYFFVSSVIQKIKMLHFLQKIRFCFQKSKYVDFCHFLQKQGTKVGNP